MFKTGVPRGGVTGKLENLSETPEQKGSSKDGTTKTRGPQVSLRPSIDVS